MTLRRILTDRLTVAFETVLGEHVDPVVRPSKQADFQADAAMQLARKVSREPQEFAQEVLDTARLEDICREAIVSGPGFINLTVSDGVLEESIARMAEEERFGVATHPPSVVVIDYSAPNIAKEMHVGHLRSTIIGDAAARLLKWFGHDVRRQNHVGDWGTPFGMLIEHLLENGGEEDESLAVGGLDKFYKAARTRFDEDPDFRSRARDRVVLLQSGDRDSIRTWKRLVGVSQRYFMDIYDRLDVSLSDEDFVGESSYQEELAPTVEELQKKGLLEESEGAICAFVDGCVGRDGSPLPLIVRKSDGAYGYAATDLAAIRRRTREMGASRILYVVGLPQSQHLGMVFDVARRAGWLRATTPEHVGFGSILGPDGKMLKSRAGVAVKLSDLLSEAVLRAGEMIAHKDPDLAEDARSRLARNIGFDAVAAAQLASSAKQCGDEDNQRDEHVTQEDRREDGCLRECVHGLHDATTREERAEQTEHVGEADQQQIPGLQHVAFFLDHHRMQIGCGGQPRHE